MTFVLLRHNVLELLGLLGRIIVQVAVLVYIIRFLRRTVHLKADLFISVLQLGGGDQVVSLRFRHVVHCLATSPFSRRLPVNVAQGNDHHAKENHDGHQTYGQRNREPLKAVLRLLFRHGSRDRVVFAVGSGEAAGAEAGRWTSRDADAGSPVEAGSGRAGVGGPVAIAAFVSRGAGADVVVDAVVARSAVAAGVGGAVVDVDLAALAGKACSTAAHANAALDHTQATCRWKRPSVTNYTVQMRAHICILI